MTYSSINFELAQFRDHLKFNLSRVRGVLNIQVGIYVYGLQGGRGVMMADGNRYDPKLFKDYSKSRDNYSNFTGLIGYGFIRRVPSKNIDKYLIGKKFNFQKTPNKTTDYLMVETFEPQAESPDLIGQDLSDDTFLKNIVWQASLKNSAMLTDLTIVKRKNETFPGFIYVLPVYNNVEVYKSNEEDRLKNTVGWIFGPMILPELLKIFESPVFSDFQLRVKIGQSDYQFDTGPEFAQEETINNYEDAVITIFGNDWKVRLFQSTSEIKRKIEAIVVGNSIFYLVCLVCIYLLVRLYDRQSRSIEEKENWLNAIMANSAHSIIAVDTNGIIRTFSPASERLLGYKGFEVIGRQTPLIFHDQNVVKKRAAELTVELGKKVEAGFEVFVAKAKLGFADTNEWPFVRKDGGRVQVKCTVTSIKDSDDNIIGFLGVSEDLTDYNKMRHRLSSKQAKLVNASKFSVLGEMAGGIAHEINTPLAIIVGKANTLKEKIKLGLPSEDIVVELVKISQTATRIGRITKSLLTYARSSEKDEPIVQPVSEIVQTTLDLCSDKIKATGIQLMLDYATPMFIQVRPGEVVQIITNLISNAIDAVKNQNNSWIEVKTISKNGFCEIWVTDSGLGIDVNIQDKILNPFFTTKPVGAGTGLGLSVSKSLTEGLKGDLILDTQSKNTRFIVRFTLISA